MSFRGTMIGFKRAAMVLAVTGATLFQTTGCSIDSLLASYGLSTLLSSLLSSSTSA